MKNLRVVEPELFAYIANRNYIAQSMGMKLYSAADLTESDRKELLQQIQFDLMP